MMVVRGIEARRLVFVDYSPAINPIEEAFAKLKELLRKSGARSCQALVEAIGTALDAITTGDVQGFLATAVIVYRPNLYERRFRTLLDIACGDILI